MFVDESCPSGSGRQRAADNVSALGPTRLLVRRYVPRVGARQRRARRPTFLPCPAPRLLTVSADSDRTGPGRAEFGANGTRLDSAVLVQRLASVRCPGGKRRFVVGGVVVAPPNEPGACLQRARCAFGCGLAG